ncbi:MaoC/PaaZ C-terminal domain-containing protein [Streptomyces lavendofoliae]|uniref:MaoC/PaaZ C-terminal domain-containing protein n=1 Tax=Streptomyces lavendofoliae TaxID=67314 RepID=UPI00300EEB88
MTAPADLAAETFTMARPGTELPTLTVPEVTDGTVVRYALASRDDNPLHLDAAAAREAGLPGTIVHGMYAMALLGRLVTGWAPQPRLISLKASFVASVPVGDSMTCTGTVTDVVGTGGGRHAHVRLAVRRGDGVLVVRGRAVVAVGEHPATAADALPGSAVERPPGRSAL